MYKKHNFKVYKPEPIWGSSGSNYLPNMGRRFT